MKTNLNNKIIIWDFDGVIVDSLKVRDDSFRWALRNYPEDKIEELVAYHKKNSGSSRFEKIKYFFEHILQLPVNNDQIKYYALQISKYAKNRITYDMLDSNIIKFISQHNGDMHIVSASMDIELKYICRKLDIAKYFITINGSQNGETKKGDTVQKIIEVFEYPIEEIVLVGDSKQDYYAASENQIKFLGYNFNNPEIGKIEILHI